MRTDHGTRAALTLAIALAAAGCTASRAPLGWLPVAEDAQREAWGGWIELRTDAGAAAAGELLAITADSVYVLRGSAVTVLALRDVRSGRLEAYDPRSGTLAGITTVGTLSTISHGVGLILTAPVWVIVGSVSTASLSAGGKYDLDPASPAELPLAPSGAAGERSASWADLRPYARFPQGWPAGLDRTSLHERPSRGGSRGTSSHGIRSR